MRGILPPAALLLGAAAAAALAQEPPGTPAPPRVPEAVDLERAEALGWFGTDWYGIHRGDALVGWVRRSLLRVDHEGRPAVAREVQVLLDVAGDGNEIESTTRTVFLAEGDQPLVLLRTERREQGRTSRREVVRRDERFDVTTDGPDGPVSGAVPARDVRLRDEVAVERLVAEARSRAAPVGTALEVAGFDVGRLSLTRRRVTIEAVEPGDAGPIHVVRVLPAAPEGLDKLRVDDRGRLVRGFLIPGLELRRAAREAVTDKERRVSLEVLSRIPLDARLEPRLGLRELVLRAVLADPGAPHRPPFRETPPRQEVSREGTDFLLTVRRAADAGPVGDEERRAALAEEPRIDATDPSIRRKVVEVLSGTSRRPVQVDRLLRFTAGHVEDMVVIGEPKASEVLATPRGDCTEHARLFVALCRAAGIPAREVHGLVWIDDEQRTFGWHTWAEVELDAHWRPVDPTRGLVPADATHVAVDDTLESRARLAGARFELVSSERDPPAGDESPR